MSLLRRTIRKLCLAHWEWAVLVSLEGTPQDLNSQYQIWLKQHRHTKKDVAMMQASLKNMMYTPCISIATPVYNTDEAWLRKAIDSVRAQVYPHWELCLVNDGSTKPHVMSVLDGYAAADTRIRVKHLDCNEGIAGASAHALRLATGEFVGLLDHDDELSPDALYEVVSRLNQDPELDLLYSDEDRLERDGLLMDPFFKPEWNPDLLLSTNYINHFSVYRRRLLDEVGGFKPGLDGSQDHDLLLRFTERTSRIARIPRVLYHWRRTPNSASASETGQSNADKAGRQAIEKALERRQHDGRVQSVAPGRYVVRYSLRDTPLVSIIIPTRDKWQLLQQCLQSIEEKTEYLRYEIIVIDNGSVEQETLEYLDDIAPKCRVCQYPGEFNFAAISNFGAEQARGEHLLFLNNDTQVINREWLNGMVEQSQRPEVGGVGAKLLYPDGRIQHAGIVMGIRGVSGHAFKNLPGNVPSYFHIHDLTRNCSAVTAACMMVSRPVFEEVGGFDERFRVAFNDVDLCLRIRQRGYRLVYTPLALLYHHESASRKRLHPLEDEDLFLKRWGDLIREGDPYYNPNLTLAREDWSLRL